jgi:hypothetical protein
MSHSREICHSHSHSCSGVNKNWIFRWSAATRQVKEWSVIDFTAMAEIVVPRPSASASLTGRRQKVRFLVRWLNLGLRKTEVTIGFLRPDATSSHLVKSMFLVHFCAAITLQCAHNASCGVLEEKLINLRPNWQFFCILSTVCDYFALFWQGFAPSLCSRVLEASTLDAKI